MNQSRIGAKCFTDNHVIPTGNLSGFGGLKCLRQILYAEPLMELREMTSVPLNPTATAGEGGAGLATANDSAGTGRAALSKETEGSRIRSGAWLTLSPPQQRTLRARNSAWYTETPRGVSQTAIRTFSLGARTQKSGSLNHPSKCERCNKAAPMQQWTIWRCAFKPLSASSPRKSRKKKFHHVTPAIALLCI
jgi:hypothetical protein